MIKVIGIGNSLMGDDGLALKVIDYIEKEINKLSLGIKCIKAETDFDYALDNIEDGDFLFILDSTLLDLEYGEITKIPLSEAEQYLGKGLSIHNMSLLSLIDHFNLGVKGFIIGIQVKGVVFSLQLSKELEDRFEGICKEVFKIIKEESLGYLESG